MENKKILYFDQYIDRIDKDEKQRKELMDLIKKIANNLTKESAL
ncbi:MAG: hypothetical protein N4A48_09670 [Tepidibacter sp.]|jgi:truncated hemoglobin YjbI|nr:hypothetical protein [Tepidibacter sp.]MCT4509011.1 hypothetical protein [Tepidibacter sp.]MCT4583773.1 hypothetical protein [Peptostreptococcaceae bacterium]